MKIIEKIKEFFRSLKKEKTLLIEESKSNNVTRKESFVKSIDIREKQENINIQAKLENNEISVNNLSIFEVMDLIDLYKEQLNIG